MLSPQNHEDDSQMFSAKVKDKDTNGFKTFAVRTVNYLKQFNRDQSRNWQKKIQNMYRIKAP